MIGALLVLFSPELIVLCVVVLFVLVFLLLHIRSFVRNTLGAAALLFSWATRLGPRAPALSGSWPTSPPGLSCSP
jgi:hypothetical protein